MTYLFETTATMKEYNCKKWWIDGNIVPAMRITADNLTAALKEYQRRVSDNCYITISSNALKNKNAMFVDTRAGAKPVGYVITASTEFETSDYKWSKQYIDLWVNISIVDTPEWETEA